MSDTKQLEGWVARFGEDVGTLGKLAASIVAPRDARRYAAAALNYVVMEGDLIPDGTSTVGLLDDAFIMRIAAALATEHDFGEVDRPLASAIQRLADEAAWVRAFVGDEMYGRLVVYTKLLSSQPVRQRSPDDIVREPALRQQLLKEVDTALRALSPGLSEIDDDRAKRELVAHFESKLGGL